MTRPHHSFLPSAAFSSPAFSSRSAIAMLLAGCVVFAGCKDNTDALRDIQTRQQQRVEASSTTDHLREAYTLFTRLGESDLNAAAGQINYHLNAWREGKTVDPVPLPEELLATWKSTFPIEKSIEEIKRRDFQKSDIEHFRFQYLLHKISNWSVDKTSLDPWLQKRVDAEKLSDSQSYDLQIASSLFDWVVRNVQLEPYRLTASAPPAPSLPDGLQFRGPGYRQTSWETLWRGSGDGWQRADLFTQLCRHAGLDACLLGLPSNDGGEPLPWVCGVLIGKDIYLFETTLGIPVPGPNEQGIATLEEARKDESILRRLKVPGVFDYPFSNQDVQQSVAIINATPELLSQRMQLLTQSFTGDQRLNLFLDAKQLAERMDAVPGVAGARLWHIPLQARVYKSAIEAALRDDIMLKQWYAMQWAVFDVQSELTPARWRHLEGTFDRNLDEDIEGARVLYMNKRRPEFELEDLRMDVELQGKYGLRRNAGEPEEEHARRVAATQYIIRETKRTVTFWLALMHVDEGSWKTAEKWLDDRVLQDEQSARWHSSARYNLARAAERLGDFERAEKLYKTDNDPQEQGNRIRARSLPAN